MRGITDCGIEIENGIVSPGCADPVALCFAFDSEVVGGFEGRQRRAIELQAALMSTLHDLAMGGDLFSRWPVCKDSLVYPELNALSVHAEESFHFAERRAKANVASTIADCFNSSSVT